jgi:hypothetical protein
MFQNQIKNMAAKAIAVPNIEMMKAIKYLPHFPRSYELSGVPALVRSAGPRTRVVSPCNKGRPKEIFGHGVAIPQFGPPYRDPPRPRKPYRTSPTVVHRKQTALREGSKSQCAPNRFLLGQSSFHLYPWPVNLCRLTWGNQL